jgi:hypothetical protein
MLVARRMYIEPPERPEPVRVPFLLGFPILVCVAGTVALAVPEAPRPRRPPRGRAAVLATLLTSPARERGRLTTGPTAPENAG